MPTGENTSDVNPWANVARVAPLTGDLVSLVEGATFAISDATGDMTPAGAQGLFHRDTRFLSRLELLVDGAKPEALAARPVDAYSARFVLRLPWSGPGESPLIAVRNRFVGDGLHEDLDVTNYGATAVELDVELRIDADFADLFDVKLRRSAPRSKRRATRRLSADEQLLQLEHVADGYRRATEVRLSGRIEELTEAGARFSVALAPGATWHTCLDVYLSLDGVRSQPKCRCDAFGTLPVPLARRATAWRERFPRLHSAWDPLNHLYGKSVDDLAALLMEDPDGAGDLVVAAGLPWFMALFGRDAILTALMAIPFDRELAAGVLRTLARHQGARRDPASEEEPGRILHEMRFGEIAARGGRRAYYGTVDATPLFVILVAEAWRAAQVLDAAQVAQLVTLAGAVETSFGAPQDIEWCLAGDRLWIVQSRPITTLPPEPVDWESPVPGAKWIKDLQAAEWATEPLSPLGATTTFATMIADRQRRLPVQRSPWSALINGWLYVRADFRLVWLVTPLSGLVAGALARTLDGRERMRRTWPRRLALLASLEQTDLGKLSDDELRARADRLLEELGFWWWEVTMYAAGALATEQLIGRLGVPGLADPAVLFRGNDSLLLEGERALHQAARTGEVDDYLARFGHFVESADPIHPTLRESPELVAQSLAAARSAGMGPDERLARIRRERTDAEGLVRVRRGPRGLLARGLLRLGQGYAAHVDDSVFHLQRVLALLRGTFVEAGGRLARAGALERAEEVFYLERGELWAPPAGSTARVNERRLLRERQRRLAPPPYVPPLSDPAWARDRLWKLFSSALGATVLARGVQEREGRRILVGTPGSPGRARGTARIIAGPADFRRFKPGDVLIAHTTTPIWTPLLNVASAAVTEVGGPFSHAAIVSREFGIPLVNGALDATQVIVDGAPIVVDGSAGIVEL